MATPNSPDDIDLTSLTAEELALLDTAEDSSIEDKAALTAEEIMRIPQNERAKELKEILKKAFEDGKFADKKMQKFTDQVEAKVKDLEEKAKNVQAGEIVKRFQDRFQLLNGKWFPSGLRRDAKVTIENDEVMSELNTMLKRGYFSRALRWVGRSSNQVDVEDIDGLITRYGEISQEIKDNEKQLKLLEATQKTGKQWDELSEAIREAARVEKGNSHFSWERGSTSKVIDSMQARAEKLGDKRTFLEKIFKKSELQKLLDQKKTLDKQKTALEKAVAEIGKLQTNAEKLFDNAYSAEINALKNFTGQEYEEKLASLRQSVRENGQKMNRVYFEYFLNKKLDKDPKNWVLHTEAELGSEKELYREPVTEKEKAEEVIHFGKWWRDFFGVPTPPPVAEVQDMIKTLKDSNQRELLREILKGNLNEEVKALFNFFFEGKYTDSKVSRTLDPACRLPLTINNFKKLVKKIPDFKKKIKDMSDLRRAFWNVLYGDDQYTLSGDTDFEKFEKLLTYPASEIPISKKERRLRDLAMESFFDDRFIASLPPDQRENFEIAKDKIQLGNFPQDLKKKAETLYEMEQDDAVKLREAVQKVRTVFDALVRSTALGNIQSPIPVDTFDKSNSWINEKLVVYRDISKGRQQNSALRKEDPLKDQEVLMDIACGHFGALLVDAWSDLNEKPKIERILQEKKRGPNSPLTQINSAETAFRTITTRGLEEEELVYLGRDMEEILAYQPPAPPPSPATPAGGPAGAPPAGSGAPAAPATPGSPATPSGSASSGSTTIPGVGPGSPGSSGGPSGNNP